MADTSTSTVQELFYLSRFDYGLSDFGPIDHLCIKGSSYHNKDGFSGDLLDVRLLRKFEAQTTT